jgi:hypothetical protein
MLTWPAFSIFLCNPFKQSNLIQRTRIERPWGAHRAPVLCRPKTRNVPSKKTGRGTGQKHRTCPLIYPWNKSPSSVHWFYSVRCSITIQQWQHLTAITKQQVSLATRKSGREFRSIAKTLEAKCNQFPFPLATDSESESATMFLSYSACLLLLLLLWLSSCLPLLGSLSLSFMTAKRMKERKEREREREKEREREREEREREVHIRSRGGRGRKGEAARDSYSYVCWQIFLFRSAADSAAHEKRMLPSSSGKSRHALTGSCIVMEIEGELARNNERRVGGRNWALRSVSQVPQNRGGKLETEKARAKDTDWVTCSCLLFCLSD